jgi:hypothetical protein
VVAVGTLCRPIRLGDGEALRGGHCPRAAAVVVPSIAGGPGCDFELLDQFVFDVGVVSEPEPANEMRYAFEARSRVGKPGRKGGLTSVRGWDIVMRVAFGVRTEPFPPPSFIAI